LAIIDWLLFVVMVFFSFALFFVVPTVYSYFR
jgi:hypothetical protein